MNRVFNVVKRYINLPHTIAHITNLNFEKIHLYMEEVKTHVLNISLLSAVCRLQSVRNIQQ